MNSDNELDQVIAKALGMSPDEIDDQTSIMSEPRWDSLAHFRIALAVEEMLGRQLTPVEVIEIVDVRSLRKLFAEANT